MTTGLENIGNRFYRVMNPIIWFKSSSVCLRKMTREEQLGVSTDICKSW